MSDFERPTNAEQEKARSESKLFSKPSFALAWIIFLAVVLRTIGWPLRNIALVCWVYGWNGYAQLGLRVLPGKPCKFSNGELVPVVPDLVTGFAAFLGTTLSLTFLLIFMVRLWERTKKTNIPPSHV